MEAGLVLMEVEKYMLRNNVLRKRDFEKYEIEIPFIYALGKRRVKFLSSELEKMHPCFSDEFTIDSAIKKITRKGLLEDIYVMNKFKLAEYERKRSLTGAGFFTEEKHGPRLFVAKKWKLTLCGIIFCLLLALTGAVCGVLAGNSVVTTNDEISDVSGNIVREEAPLVAEVQAESVSLVEEKIFSAVAAAGGKISRFELFTDFSGKNKGSFSEKVTASLQGVFPESLMEYCAETVAYEKGIPFLNVFYERNIERNIHSSVNPLEGNVENPELNKSLREAIYKYGGGLKEEKTAPCHIVFTCRSRPETELKKLFQEANQIIAETNSFVTGLSINQIGKEELQIELSIENKNVMKDFWSGFDLILISENLDLFLDLAEVEKTEEPVMPAKSVQQFQTYKKIGEIKKSDKSSIIFYKSQEGKIERQVQTSMEEI